MEFKSWNHRSIVLWSPLLILTLLVLDSRSMKNDIILHRVVFQTVVLSDGSTVQCYGRCDTDPLDKFGERAKFNVSRCEGKKLRFGCEKNLVIKIHLANLGQMYPASEVCQQRESIGCLKNVADDLEEKCDAEAKCVYEVTNDPLHKICGLVQYLYFDVRFLCIPRAITAATTVSTRKKSSKLSTKSVVPSQPVTERSVEHKFVFVSSTMVPEDPTPTKALVIVVRSPASKDGGMFWLMTAYTWFMDKKFIQANGTHLALAIILSVFIGLVLSLCFVLDHCRRQRLKRAREKAIMADEHRNGLITADGGTFENVEMNDLVRVDHFHMNGNPPMTRESHLTRGTEHRDPDASESRPLLQQKQDAPQRNHADLPPPPKELLESPDDHATALIPPPAGFENESAPNPVNGGLPALVASSFLAPARTSGSPPGAVQVSIQGPATEGPSSSAHVTRSFQIFNRDREIRTGNPADKPSADMLIGKSSSSQSDNNSTIPWNRSQRDILNPPVVLASPSQQRQHSNSSRPEELCSYEHTRQTAVAAEVPDRSRQTSHVSQNRNPMSERIYPTDPKKTLRDISNGDSVLTSGKFQSPLLHQELLTKGQLRVERSTESPSNTPPFSHEPCFTNLPGFEYRMPAPKPGRFGNSNSMADVVYTKETLPPNTKIYTVPRHKCGSGHDHACICVPVRTAAESFTCACLEKAKIGYRGCCMTACDTSKIIQKEPYSAQRACTPAASEQSAASLGNQIRTSAHARVEDHPDHKLNPAIEHTGSCNSTDSRSVGVEESGYHSHGTGTDSLCSSARSTDQEDSQMFHPASQLSTRSANSNSVRSKILRSREKTSKKDPKLTPTPAHTKTLSRSERRSRYESKGVADIGPSESSLDDECGDGPAKSTNRAKFRPRKKEAHSLIGKMADDGEGVSPKLFHEGQGVAFSDSALIRRSQRKISKNDSRVDDSGIAKQSLNSFKTL